MTGHELSEWKTDHEEGFERAKKRRGAALFQCEIQVRVPNEITR